MSRVIFPDDQPSVSRPRASPEKFFALDVEHCGTGNGGWPSGSSWGVARQGSGELCSRARQITHRGVESVPAGHGQQDQTPEKADDGRSSSSPTMARTIRCATAEGLRPVGSFGA